MKKPKEAVVNWCQCGMRSNPYKSDHLKSRLFRCYRVSLFSFKAPGLLGITGRKPTLCSDV